jgi:thymidylate kinase
LYAKFGYIVIFDRHFIYDFYDFNDKNKEQKTVTRRIHDLIRNNTMLEPDLVICLDAPGEVVFKRKGEFNIEDLEIKRRQYIELQKFVKNFVIIDANRSFEVVLKDVGDHIMHFYQSTQ